MRKIPPRRDPRRRRRDRHDAACGRLAGRRGSAMSSSSSRLPRDPARPPKPSCAAASRRGDPPASAARLSVEEQDRVFPAEPEAPNRACDERGRDLDHRAGDRRGHRPGPRPRLTLQLARSRAAVADRADLPRSATSKPRPLRAPGQASASGSTTRPSSPAARASRSRKCCGRIRQRHPPDGLARAWATGRVSSIRRRSDWILAGYGAHRTSAR